MTSHDTDAAALRRLSELHMLSPDAERAAQVRARCRAQFMRQRRRSERRAALAGVARNVIAPVLVAGLCVWYVVALLVIAVAY